MIHGTVETVRSLPHRPKCGSPASKEREASVVKKRPKRRPPTGLGHPATFHPPPPLRPQRWKHLALCGTRLPTTDSPTTYTERGLLYYPFDGSYVVPGAFLRFVPSRKKINPNLLPVQTGSNSP